MLLRSIFFLLLFSTLPVAAQDTTNDAPMRTLLGGDKQLHHGGWGAPTIHYTRIMDQDALLVGGRGAWIIDHRLSIGIAGHGLVTNVGNAAYDAHLVANGEVLRRSSSLYMGYGGLLLEPVIAYRSPVHITLPVIIGAGGVTYGYHSELPDDFDPLEYDDTYDAQAFFVVEPGVEVEMDVIPLVRVGIGASYRYTTDMNLPATAKDALHGINAGISLKVGCF
ncbi:MAG: hypothetical protein WAT74_16855 [Flavobacteriales bacterium]